MKNTLIGLGIVVVIGGAVYALVPRTVLKSYFQTGDKPTQAQFENTIDSDVNMQDDKRADTAVAEQRAYNPKEYTVGDAQVKSDQVVKTRIVTEKQSEFKLDRDESIRFTWTRVEPTYGEEPPMYRIRVWQLMQGQTGAQAMKSNQPIQTKDVGGNPEVILFGLYTGPCKPPYLCEFVWSVEAISAASINTGTDGAASSPTPAKPEETTAAPSDGTPGSISR